MEDMNVFLRTFHDGGIGDESNVTIATGIRNFGGGLPAVDILIEIISSRFCCTGFRLPLRTFM